MDFIQCSKTSISDVFNAFQTGQGGLNTKEIQRRLKIAETNQINKNIPLKIFIRQLQSSFIYLLFGAVILSFILGERTNALLILLFVSFNIGLSFFQEYRSTKALELLKKYTVNRAKVKRSGEILQIPSTQVVDGDIVLIEAGDIIPADIRIIDTNELLLDESLLTGESNLVEKETKTLKKVDTIFNAKNIGFAGTHVQSGLGLGVVFGTGRNTQVGNITRLTSQTEKISGYEKSLQKLSTFILILVLITLGIVFILHFLVQSSEVNFIELLIFSIALAISVIPETLPVVITFSLSQGVRALSKKHVIVKRLSAIEDLGGIQVLCTDKTGTITENRLTIIDTYGTNTDELMEFASLGITGDHGSKNLKDPFDNAILLSLTQTQQDNTKKLHIVNELPFTPERKRNSVLIRNNSDFLIVRGAGESILPFCKNIRSKEKELYRWIEAKGKQAQRVLAVAVRKDFHTLDYSYHDEEHDLEFIGLIAFADKIKTTAKETVKQAKELGIQIKILTGDSKEVAFAVACEVGLIESQDDVIIGEDFEKLTSPQQHASVKSHAVFARVTPEQKFKILSLLQESYTVGFLGEGINDAPALKLANVALVVDDASDIARESADIILLDKSLHVIITGIKEGRKIFANTTKYIKTTLSANFGNFYALALSTLFVPYLPMLPIQILLLNLLSDFPMVSIATDSVDKEDVTHPQKYDIKDIVLIATILGIVSSFFDFLFFAIFKNYSQGILQTAWFMGSVLTELVFIFSLRSKHFIFKSIKPSTLVIVGAVIAAIAAIVLPFTKLGTVIFSFVPISKESFFIIIAVVGAYLIVTETVKVMYYRRLQKA